MLNKINRLKKRYQFQYIYKNGNYLNEKAVTLYFVSSKTKNVKIGFAIGKKIGHAISRNLVKRRLREIVKPMIEHMNQSYNLIIYAKEGILDYSFEQLQNQITKLFNKANLIKNDEKDF